MAQPKKVESVCVPLDPDDCGSVIHGYVRFPELYRRNYGGEVWDIEYNASISLSDCNRVIQWSLTGDEDGHGTYNVSKLDVAIGALTKMREYMVQAQVEYDILNKEANERNEALKNGDVHIHNSKSK